MRNKNDKGIKNLKETKKMDVNDNNFEKEVIERSNEMPVIVDFWAEWCQPCLMLGPILKKVSSEYSEKINLVKANVEETRSYSEKYGINAIPAVKLFKNGNLTDEFIGLIPEEKIKEFIERNI